MAVAVPARLYVGVPTTGETTLFTAKEKTNIRTIHASGDATGGTVSLSVVAKGGTAGATNRIAQAFAVGAAASVGVLASGEAIALNPGDFISGIQSSGTHITLAISGDEYAG